MNGCSSQTVVYETPCRRMIVDCRRRFMRSTRRSVNSKRNFVSWRTLFVVCSRRAPLSSKTSPSRKRRSRSTRRSAWVYARRCQWIPRSAQYSSFHQSSVRRLSSLTAYQRATHCRHFSYFSCSAFFADLKHVLSIVYSVVFKRLSFRF